MRCAIFSVNVLLMLTNVLLCWASTPYAVDSFTGSVNAMCRCAEWLSFTPTFVLRLPSSSRWPWFQYWQQHVGQS